MANYNEQTGSGTSWTRAKQVIINNNYNTTKNIVFFEEDIATVGDKVFQSNAGMLTAQFNPQGIINLRDLQTGERTGNVVSQALVYQAIYSLYLDLAEARDITAAPPRAFIVDPNAPAS